MCKHSNTTPWVWFERLQRWQKSWSEADRRICDDCHAWLPLGHSDETPERVAVEIRAAELAAAFTKDRGTADDATIDENVGWLVHLNEWTHLDRERGFPVNDEQHTGWLAREIATHKETP